MTLMTSHSRSVHPRARRKLDVASLALLIVSIVSGILAYWLATEQNFNPLIIAPAIIAGTTGATHLIKYVAPRD